MSVKEVAMGRLARRMALGLAVVIVLDGTAFAQWYVEGKPAADLDFAKSDGAFRVSLFLTNDPKAFFEAWKRPKDPVPISGSNRADLGTPIEAIVIFSNCQAGPDGLCDATVDFAVFRPDGSVYGKFEDAELWQKKPPPEKDRIQFGVQTMGVKIEPGDPAGKYRVETTVRDKVRGSTLQLTQPFWVGAKHR
jgi:hypothetical protein